MNIVMAQLLDILDSWITFEDDVMIELDAAESASQFTMQGIVGEVHLVESASQFTMQGIVGEVGLVTDTSNLLMDSVLETVCLDKKPICTSLQTELLGGPLLSNGLIESQYWLKNPSHILPITSIKLVMWVWQVDTQATETTTLTQGLMEHMMGQLQ